MSTGFVWFDHRSSRPADARRFYADVLGWTMQEGPPGMTMVVGSDGPWGGISELAGDPAAVTGWVPFVRVRDVDGVTRQAVAHGATVLQERTAGPAGLFSVVRDPAGAVVALWQEK
jgi:hypothetical protein